MREVVLTGITATIDTPMGWTPSAEECDRADAMIGTVGLLHKATDVWPTLSQGERDRTLIARIGVRATATAARRDASGGAARATVTTDNVSAAFNHPVVVGYDEGRWTPRAKVLGLGITGTS